MNTRFRIAAVCVLALGSLLAAGVPPAQAETPVVADQIEESASTASNFAAPPAAGAEVDSSGVEANLLGGEMVISVEPEQGLQVESPSGVSVALGVGDVEGEGQVVGSDVVFETNSRQASVVARASTEGAQALIVIEGASAPTEYEFPVQVENGIARLGVTSDGEIEIWSPSESHPAATVAPPWAIDANGFAVPTRFEIRGSSLVQVVDHEGAAYPVVADPKYTWGWVTGTTYYNRKETRSLKTRSYGYIVAAALCAAFGTQTAGVACAVAGAVVAQWNYVASNAYGDGKCAKIKIPIMWAYAYSGGYCK